MDEIFANLTRLQDQISKDPASFSETNSNVIFSLLEENNNSYTVVFNMICKNSGAKRKFDERRSQSPVAGGSRSRSPSYEVIQEDDTLGKLKSIFPSKPAKYLKEKVRNNPGLDADRLAALILDDRDSDQPSTPTGPARKRPCNLDDSVILVESSENLHELKESSANLTLDIASTSQSILVDSEEETEEVYLNLLGIFPHLDPDYLKKEADRIGKCEDRLQTFIDSTVGRGGLPTRKDYELKQKKKRETERIKKLKVSDFLREFEDPIEHYNKTNRPVSDQYKDSCKRYIQKRFSYLRPSQIDKVLEENKFHFLPSIKQLMLIPATRKGKQKSHRDADSDGWDINFLKEYIFYKLEDKVKQAMGKEEELRKKRVEEARKTGALFECMVCFADECLLSEVCMCPSDHMFCGTCVRRGSEVQIGDNSNTITCFNTDCGKEFDLQVLEKVLNARIYQKLLERRQAQDVTNAGIQNLVQCPFCNYAVIMPESEKLFNCGNPECGKISCRTCKEESHLPLRCEEVEKDDEVKARTKLENAMTEAMIRECPKCKNRFFKTEGCNLMHCHCGTTICYLCRKVVPNNYKHFYGQGAEPQPGLCPLFSDNKNLHKAEVLKAAQAGKAAVKDKLKNDPTKNIDAPPAGYDPNRLHVQQGHFAYDYDDDDDDYDDDDDDDEDVDDEDEDDEDEDDDEYDEDDDDAIVEYHNAVEFENELLEEDQNHYAQLMADDADLDWIDDDDYEWGPDYDPYNEDEQDYYD